MITETKIEKKEDSTVLSLIILGALALVWGSSFILIKRGLQVYSPLQVGSFRIFAAGIFCLIFSLFKLKEIPFHKWKYAAISGLLGNFFPSLLFAVAGSKLNSSLSGILNAFTPLATLLIGWLFFQRNVSLGKTLGISIGLIGCLWLVFMNSKGSFQFNSYAFLPMVATVMYGINLNFYKQYLSDVSPVWLAMLALGLVSIPSGIIVFSTDFVEVTMNNKDSLNSIIYILILAFMGSAVATVLSNKLNQIASPLLASSVTYLIPVVAIMWGLLDGEALGWSHLFGMIVIVAGIFVVNKSK